MQPVAGFNFQVFFSPPTQASTAFDAGDALVAAGGLAGAAVSPANAIGFAEVRGLDSEIEIEEYREGGRNIGPHQLPRGGRYSRLVFRRGVTDSTFLWDWWADVITHSYTLEVTKAPPRRNGVVLLQGRDRTAVAGWLFTNALPERLVGPALDARGGEIAIETLELAHEGLLRLSASNLPAAV
jgi:phage tail-like protein